MHPRDSRVSAVRDMTPHAYAPRMPPKRSEFIAQRIVKEIRLRKLRPGDPLAPEPEMCAGYGVGRSTLREALRILELLGVLEVRAGRGGGPVVAAPNSRHLASALALLMQFSETTFASVVEMRGYLEPIAASLCAVRRDEDTIVGLKESVAAMRAHLDDEAVFLVENHNFHSLVADGTNNPLITYVSNSLDWILDGAPLGVQFTRSARRSVLAVHEVICGAIAEGKPEQAGKAMERHIAEAGRYYEKKFPDVMSQVVTWELYGL
ncbi:FadR family transcriptional regulator [Nocardia nova]|uniref:FadR/GntR family transcriptional regulator n=1 Tax=Nocardia nova TaxID=37330 RepID=UPI0025B0ACDD|nr:FadR/GntR family transcriptional regulator [Nocardia nova]MDN2495249.1 FadR family transcriptional regulator [Nocardia nova]